MADDLRMALAEVLRKAQAERDVDFLREGVRVLSQALMELEVTQHVGATLMEDAEADVLAYLAFPLGHWTKIWSNNPLERLIKEVKRCTDVIGIFPNTAAIIRLVGAILAEQHEEWQITRRYLSMESLTKLLGEVETAPTPALVPVG